MMYRKEKDAAPASNHDAMKPTPTHTSRSFYYHGVPDYLVKVYDWSYVNPRWVKKLDNNIVVWFLLFGQAGRLIRAYLNEITPGARVCQIAHVHGDQTVQVAQRVGPNGFFELIDVAPIQLERARQKLSRFPWVKVDRCDGTQFTNPAAFDVVGSFFLLHEVPDETKHQIVDNMLAHVGPNGKAVFIDYHRPAMWQPVRLILKVVNAVLEPFANAIWEHPIRDFASRADDFVWTTRTFFGGVYQCTVAQRRAPPR
jgi:SAM-dependent methyltransferase